MVTCGSCGREVPQGNHCIRCGRPLARSDRSARSRGNGFSAAPNERRLSLHIVSTLFPQLPRESILAFKIALGVGLALVLGLGVAGLYPVALVVAAVVVPVLTVLYLYDVDLYEDQPFRVVALTVAWGILAGVAVGLLSRATASSGLDIFSRSRTSDLLTLGILLPLLSTALMLAGPLVLLPYRRFNDVLDGAMFGAVCAVSFGGAVALTHAAQVLDAGLRPVGAVGPWIQQLLETAVVLPALAAGAVGGAAATFWLRYRAPVHDRDALGVLGRPLVGVVAASLSQILAAVVQLYLDGWVGLVPLALMAAGALLWLRLAIHLGLTQEAEEISVGPDIVCANCGSATPSHAFCRNCGISFLALPKAGVWTPATAPRPGEES